MTNLPEAYLKDKIPVLLKAMDGVLTPIQKKLVKAILDHIDDMTRRINDLDDIINNEMKHYEDAINKIEEMPGIAKKKVFSTLNISVWLPSVGLTEPPLQLRIPC